MLTKTEALGLLMLAPYDLHPSAVNPNISRRKAVDLQWDILMGMKTLAADDPVPADTERTVWSLSQDTISPVASREEVRAGLAELAPPE